MREFSLPALYEVPSDGNLTDLIRRNAAQHPDVAVMSRKVDGRWQDVTATEFLAEVRATAKGLIASGIRPGERVALISRTRYEWVLFDFAIWTAGGVTVPVYETSSPEQIQWILGDSGASAVVVESPGHSATVAGLRDRLPELREVWEIEQGAPAAPAPPAPRSRTPRSTSAPPWRTPTTRRPSSTPRAPRAAPRAVC